MSSNATPLVSGTMNFTQTSCRPIMLQKKRNMNPARRGWSLAPESLTIIGNRVVDRRREKPVRKTAQRLAFNTKLVWKYFRDEHPDDRPLTDGVGGDEAKDANGNNRKMFSKERPSDQSQREDVTKRADIEQRAPPQTINEPQPKKSENQVGQADADGLQQRGFGTQTGQFKDARRKVENGVDAGELVEEGDQKCQQDRRLELSAPKTRGFRAHAGGRGNLVRQHLQFA